MEDPGKQSGNAAAQSHASAGLTVDGNGKSLTEGQGVYSLRTRDFFKAQFQPDLHTSCQRKGTQQSSTLLGTRKVGISGVMAILPETPAFAGMTSQGSGFAIHIIAKKKAIMCFANPVGWKFRNGIGPPCFVRHASESWHLRPHGDPARDPSFRWGDEQMKRVCKVHNRQKKRVAETTLFQIRLIAVRG